VASYWNPSPDFRYLLSESSERALMRFVVCTGGPVLFHTGVWQEAVCQTEPVPVYGGRRRTNLLPCLTPPPCFWVSLPGEWERCQHVLVHSKGQLLPCIIELVRIHFRSSSLQGEKKMWKRLYGYTIVQPSNVKTNTIARRCPRRFQFVETVSGDA
jgi:hypothetical protein